MSRFTLETSYNFAQHGQLAAAVEHGQHEEPIDTRYHHGAQNTYKSLSRIKDLIVRRCVSVEWIDSLVGQPRQCPVSFRQHRQERFSVIS